MNKRKVWVVMIALILVVVVAVLLILPIKKEHVIFAFDDDFSDDALLDVIDTYQKKARPFEVHPKPTYVSFDVDFPVKSCGVTRLSYVDESNMEEELHSYVDSSVGKLIEGSTIKLDTSWWYNSGEWTQQHKLWSYLVRVQDMNGAYHYYYFRVDFSQ